MKRHLLLAAAALFCAQLQAAPPDAGNPRPTTASLAQDIGSAGRLRLQSQRLAKLYLQIGLQINAETARKQLSNGSIQFAADLLDLGRYANNARTQRALARTGALWAEFKVALATPYGTENMNRVNYLSDELMITAGKLAMQIEGEAATPVGRLLDLSLRQSMLAQRLARLYLMEQSGDKSRGRLVDVEQARKEFAAALDELINARENSPASREALDLAKTQWVFFYNEIRELGHRESNPRHVTTASERIMETLDTVSAQYARDYATTANAAETTSETRLARAGGGTRRN